MREIDRIVVEEFKLGLLQMMENAGRNLAEVVMSSFEEFPGPVLILAGSGGNGGGGRDHRLPDCDGCNRDLFDAAPVWGNSRRYS